jgi:hypothetical protein
VEVKIIRFEQQRSLSMEQEIKKKRRYRSSWQIAVSPDWQIKQPARTDVAFRAVGMPLSIIQKCGAYAYE